MVSLAAWEQPCRAHGTETRAPPQHHILATRTQPSPTRPLTSCACALSAGGLPVNWLGKQRPLRNLQYLDLSGNRLGFDAAGVQYTTTSQWCPDDTGVADGSGWCPSHTPIYDTLGSLVSLDLSDNSLQGEREGNGLYANKLPGRGPRVVPMR